MSPLYSNSEKGRLEVWEYKMLIIYIYHKYMIIQINKG